MGVQKAVRLPEAPGPAPSAPPAATTGTRANSLDGGAANDDAMTVAVEPTVAAYSVGLFDCCAGGCASCLYAVLCPPCAAATAMSRVNGADPCFTALCLCNCVAYRSMVRESYHIEGNWCDDVCIGMWCAQCSAVQNYNEAAVRGTANLKIGARAAAPMPWLTGPWDWCAGGAGNCLLGCCAMPCANARARTNFDGSNMCFNLMCVGPCMTRSLIRKGYNLEGSCAQDMCFTCACYPCAAAQALTEVDRRGKVTKRVMSVSSLKMARCA